MKELFIKGGIIMWPILVVSIIAITTVIERIIFVLMESGRRQPRVVRDIFYHLEHRDPESAIKIGELSKDYVARTLVAGLKERHTSFTNALLWRSSEELRRYNRGLATLDTVITLSPLLGLLGTVTGMIGAFSILNGAELNAPTAITGGIAEALIATAFGLSVAIIALVPYNFLNARLEAARREIEIAGNRMELLLIKLAAEKNDDRLTEFARP